MSKHFCLCAKWSHKYDLVSNQIICNCLSELFNETKYSDANILHTSNVKNELFMTHKAYIHADIRRS